MHRHYHQLRRPRKQVLVHERYLVVGRGGKDKQREHRAGQLEKDVKRQVDSEQRRISLELNWPTYVETVERWTGSPRLAGCQ